MHRSEWHTPEGRSVSAKPMLSLKAEQAPDCHFCFPSASSEQHLWHSGMQRGPLTTGNRDIPVGTKESATLREKHLAEPSASGSLAQASPLHDGVVCAECLKIYLNRFPEFKKWEISH